MLTLAVEPIYLESAPAAEPATEALRESTSIWGMSTPGALLVLFSALLVVAACLFAYRYLKRRAQTSDLDAAFSRLALRTGLPRRSRKAVLALSQASGIPAAAMLISRGAFTAAVANADTDQAKNARAAAPRLMQSLFAELAPPTNPAGILDRITKRNQA